MLSELGPNLDITDFFERSPEVRYNEVLLYLLRSVTDAALNCLRWSALRRNKRLTSCTLLVSDNIQLDTFRLIQSSAVYKSLTSNFKSLSSSSDHKSLSLITNTGYVYVSAS